MVDYGRLVGEMHRRIETGVVERRHDYQILRSNKVHCGHQTAGACTSSFTYGAEYGDILYNPLLRAIHALGKRCTVIQRVTPSQEQYLAQETSRVASDRTVVQHIENEDSALCVCRRVQKLSSSSSMVDLCLTLANRHS